MLEDLIKDLTAAIRENTEARRAEGGATAKATTKPATAKASTKTTASAGPTLDDIKEKFGGYLANVKGAEKAKRMKEVSRINAFFEVEKASLLKPENYEQALTWLQAFIDGEEPDGLPDDEDDAGVV